MTSATSSSATNLVILQSIAAAVGIAAVHAFVVDAIRRKQDDPAVVQPKTQAHNCCKKVVSDHPTCIIVTLPEWATGFYNERKDIVYTSEEDMMHVAMELSKTNCLKNTGGPFGTAIFEYDPRTKESKLFSIGLNRVVPLSNSTLHGEMTAIQFGQQKIGSFSFSSVGQKCGKEYHLYTSCEPCCQCLGGTMWSGVSKLVCGATKADAEAIGFSEGPVFDPQSYNALEESGCKVRRGVLREKCKDVLDWYGKNGEIYNP